MTMKITSLRKKNIVIQKGDDLIINPSLDKMLHQETIELVWLYRDQS